jgi:hypothetical protein
VALCLRNFPRLAPHPFRKHGLDEKTTWLQLPLARHADSIIYLHPLVKTILDLARTIMTDTFACTIDETLMGDGDDTMTMPMSLRHKPSKSKSIEYGPAPKHLVESVRKHLRQLIELPDLDSNLGVISRFALTSDDMLTSVKSAVAVMKDEHAITIPGTPDAPANIETYGATFLRTLIAQLTAHQDSSLRSPEMMVSAIAAARRDGMPDVAAALEEKLVGKKLDGKRPVDSGVLPYLQEAIAADNAKGAVKNKRSRKKKVVASMNPGSVPVHLNGGTA